jgi:hypothetical protein
MPTVAAPPPVSSREEKRSRFAWGITIISSISLFLTLLGFGVSLSVETAFGVPHQTVFSNVFDLVGLSVYALLSLILGLGKIAWQPLFEQAGVNGLVAAGALFVLACCMICSRALGLPTRVRMSHFWRHVGPPTPSDSNGRLVIKGAIGSSLFGGAMIITPFLLISALLSMIVLISIVPMLGMQLGAHYLQEFVIAPKACEPVRNGASRLAAAAKQKKRAPTDSSATCVSLFKDGSRVASGRVVVSTPTAIVLFAPLTGFAWRVPIAELTVQATSDVETIELPKK